ncbi:MAG: suppressor of fused domain protein [Kofleriaceae bacterium]|nr:suppressor of fused domain protein [Kofleriaceae bacterium]
MFTNKSAGEINFRVVFYGPSHVGRTATLQYLYNHVPADQKGKMMSFESKTERTVFFDVFQPEFGECNGNKVRVHLYALHGEVNYEASSRLILKNVDAIVFLADAQREREEANRWWADALKKHISAQGRGIDSVPLCICVTKSSFENAADPVKVVASLDLPPAPTFNIDPTSGKDIPAMLATVVKALKEGVATSAVTEWTPTDEERARGQEFTARACLIGHYCSSIGEDIAEYTPAVMPEDRPGFIVVEHRPTSSRPYYTYATAGLSLWAQVPGGPQPRLELLAYSPAEDQRVADVLIVLAKGILALTEEGIPYRIHDTVDLSGCGLMHEKFVLAPPIEADELLRFPDPATRMEDVRYTHAITGNLEDSVDVTFMHVVPVTDDELSFATENGTPALLKKMDLPKRGRAFGWARGARDSTLKGKLLGLFG